MTSLPTIHWRGDYEEISREYSAITRVVVSGLRETELGGEQIYKTALACAVNADLKEEWERYLEETLTHQRVLAAVFEQAMEMARAAGDRAAAELVAAECVVLAETKDHTNWELIGTFAEQTSDTQLSKVLQQAYEAVATDEAHHLFHTQGWSRELWIQSQACLRCCPLLKS